MYIHHLGNQNLERLNRYKNTGTVNTNATAAGGVNFAGQLQKASAGQKRTGEADRDPSSSVNDADTCCEQCKLNSELIARMLTQSLYMQSGLSGLGGLSSLAGLSTLGSSARAALAYQSMSGMLNGVFGSI